MSRYTEGQTHQLMEALEGRAFTPDHIRKLAQCRELDDLKLFLDRKAKIVPTIKKDVWSEPLMLDATTGQEVKTAKKVFKGYCDPIFKDGCTDDPTGLCAMDVQEMMEKENYLQTFDSGYQWNTPQLTRSQIVVFCRDHRDRLFHNSYGTFFSFKKGKWDLFVANVSVGKGDLLSVSVRPIISNGTMLLGCGPNVVVRR